VTSSPDAPANGAATADKTAAPAGPTKPPVSGSAELEIASPVDAGRVRQFQQQLANVEGVFVRMVWSVPRKGTTIAVDLRQPVSLVEELRGLATVADVQEAGKRGSVHRIAVKLHPAESSAAGVH
jgi:hypothetical protein